MVLWQSSRWALVLRSKTSKTLLGPVIFSVFIYKKINSRIWFRSVISIFHFEDCYSDTMTCSNNHLGVTLNHHKNCFLNGWRYLAFGNSQTAWSPWLLARFINLKHTCIQQRGQTWHLILSIPEIYTTKETN